MERLWSLKILCEYVSTPSTNTGSVFEELVVLVHARDVGTAEQKMRDFYAMEEPYGNAAGGETLYRMVRMLDVFEVVDPVVIPGDRVLAEVYSRHLQAEKGWGADEMVTRYRLDV